MEAQVAQAALSQASSKSWWDDRFTRLLLEAIPSDAQQIIEYRCATGNAAYSLLPALPSAHYIGVETDAEQLREAERQAAATRYASRISLRLGAEFELPVPDHLADVVLSVLKLQNCVDAKALLTEFARALKPSGRLVAFEPDNLGQRFYFDGVLEELNQKFHQLCLRARVLRQPADVAIGPRLPQLLKRLGFRDIKVEMHMIGSNRFEHAKAFCDRVQRITDQTAELAGIYEQAEEYQAVVDAVRRFQFVGLPKRLGHSAHLVPAFLVSATPG